MQRIIKELPILNNKANVLEVTLYYTKGGMNYFTGNNEKRGLYLSVTPIEKGEFSRGFSAFSGVKKHVKEMTRFNQKVLVDFVPNEADVEQLINHVIQKNNLEVVRETKV